MSDLKPANGSSSRRLIHWLFPDDCEPRLPKILRPGFFWFWHRRWAFRHPIVWFTAVVEDCVHAVLRALYCREGCNDAIPAEGWWDTESMRTCSRCGTTACWW